MITVRRAADRGHANHGWLDSHHTFSFADYYDPRYMGFGVLRVINDDTVAPAAGFAPHGHRDMEIISYILSGALEHKDSMGNGSVIKAGEVQRMSAGTGVTHSEFNASRQEPVHFLQIWIEPSAVGLPPGYEQKYFDVARNSGRLVLLASPDAREGSLRINQDVRVFAASITRGSSVTYDLRDGRKAWMQVARGNAEAGGLSLNAGDGVAIQNERRIEVSPNDGGGEVLLFDLPS